MIVGTICLLFIHFIADFVYQPRWMGKGKSDSIKILINHVVTYTAVVFLCLLLIGHYWSIEVLYFAIVTFVTHLVIDYITSRLGSRLWNKGKEYESLLVLGFDQFLHTSQLILTYYFLFV